MKHLILLALAVLLLAGCATEPQLTTVVNAPVRVACSSTLPPRPKLNTPTDTPCAPAATSVTCFQDYRVDHALLLGHVTTLEGIIRACN